MATLGFIGTGNMGGALARAACKTVPGDEVFLANRTVEKAQALAEERWQVNWLVRWRTMRRLPRAPISFIWG